MSDLFSPSSFKSKQTLTNTFQQPMSVANVSSLGVMFTVYTENSIRPLHEVLQQQAHATVCSFSKVGLCAANV